MPVEIDYKKCCWKNGNCTGCSCQGTCIGCAEACPVQAITRKKKVIVDEKKCIECGACISACKYHAISIS